MFERLFLLIRGSNPRQSYLSLEKITYPILEELSLNRSKVESDERGLGTERRPTDLPISLLPSLFSLSTSFSSLVSISSLLRRNSVFFTNHMSPKQNSISQKNLKANTISLKYGCLVTGHILTLKG